MKFYCIINPFSGGKHGRLVLKHLQKLFSDGVFQGHAVESDPASFSEQIAKSAGFDCLLLGGGDGTISNALQVLNGLDSAWHRQ